MESFGKGALAKGRRDPQVIALIDEARAKLPHHAAPNWISRSPTMATGMEGRSRMLAEQQHTQSLSSTIAPQAASAPSPQDILSLDSPPRDDSADESQQGDLLGASRQTASPATAVPAHQSPSQSSDPSPSQSPSMHQTSLMSRAHSPSSPAIELTAGTSVQHTTGAITRTVAAIITVCTLISYPRALIYIFSVRHHVRNHVQVQNVHGPLVTVHRLSF